MARFSLGAVVAGLVQLGLTRQQAPVVTVALAYLLQSLALAWRVLAVVAAESELAVTERLRLVAGLAQTGIQPAQTLR